MKEMQRTIKYAEIEAMAIVDSPNGPQIRTTHVRVIAPNVETAKKLYLKENPADRIKSAMMFQSRFVISDSDFLEMAIEHDRHACDDNGKDIDTI